MKLLNQKMDNHTNIILYSKFSPASRKFVEMLDKIPNFNLLCIDNKKTRERILKSNSLNVKEVPCILRVYQDTGYVETFEGERAFHLLRTYIDQYKAQQIPVKVTPTPILQPQQTPIQQLQPQQTPIQQFQPQQTPIQQFQPQQLQPQQLPVQQSQLVSQLVPERLPKQDSIKKQQQLINATAIEDLGSDINKGQTMNTYMHVPKSVEFDIDIENRQRTVKQDRSVKSNDGAGNIVNRAMQMQKEREQESSMQPMNRSVG